MAEKVKVKALSNKETQGHDYPSPPHSRAPLYSSQQGFQHADNQISNEWLYSPQYRSICFFSLPNVVPTHPNKDFTVLYAFIKISNECSLD